MIINLPGQHLQLEMERVKREVTRKHHCWLTLPSLSVGSSDEFNSAFLLGMKICLVQEERSG